MRRSLNTFRFFLLVTYAFTSIECERNNYVKNMRNFEQLKKRERETGKQYHCLLLFISSNDVCISNHVLFIMTAVNLID